MSAHEDPGEHTRLVSPLVPQLMFSYEIDSRQLCRGQGNSECARQRAGGAEAGGNKAGCSCNA